MQREVAAAKRRSAWRCDWVDGRGPAAGRPGDSAAQGVRCPDESAERKERTHDLQSCDVEQDYRHHSRP